METVNFAWKVPDCQSERKTEEDVKIVSKLKQDIKIFSSQRTRKNFCDKFTMATKSRPSIDRGFWKKLTGDCSAAPNSATADVDERVANFLLHTGDTELIYDMRSHNGRTPNEDFNEFWTHLKTYLDELSVVKAAKRCENTLCRNGQTTILAHSSAP